MRTFHIEINQKTSFDFVFRKIFNHYIGNPYAPVTACYAAVGSVQFSILVGNFSFGNSDSISFVFVVNSTDETVFTLCDGTEGCDTSIN